MRFIPYSLKFALLATTSIAGVVFAGELPTLAATLSNSEAFLRIDRFNITPQNPNADSSREAIAFTGNDDSIADANSDGILGFVTDENNAFLDLDFNSNSSGSGSDYFSFGESSAIASSTFFLDSNETLSFDFSVSLALSNTVDSELDGSVNSFSEISFALFDDFNNELLGDFRAIGNLDTNLADGINNDLIFATSNLDFEITFFDDERLFGSDLETASIDLIGNIQQTVTTPTRLRLEANSFNLSCTQAIQTSNPCLKQSVPESNNLVGLVLAFIGIGLFSQKQKRKSVNN